VNDDISAYIQSIADDGPIYCMAYTRTTGFERPLTLSLKHTVEYMRTERFKMMPLNTKHSAQSLTIIVLFLFFVCLFACFVFVVS